MANPLRAMIPNQTWPLLRWRNLTGSSLALALLAAAEQHNGLLLVIAGDHWQAKQLLADLNFFQQDKLAPFPILFFPDWETLPYEALSPHRDLISERLYVLSKLPLLTSGILISSINTLMHPLPPTHYIMGHTFNFKVKERLSLTDLQQQFQKNGYWHVAEVMAHGEFSIRGSIVDIFPMGSNLPYRLDFFDNEIESIRSFDPETQLSVTKYQSIELLPSREFALNGPDITRFRQNWRTAFSGNPLNCTLYTDVSESIASPGIEYYLPLFFEKTASIADYLPTSTLVVQLANSIQLGEEFWQEIQQRYEQFSYDITRPILSPSEAFIPLNQLLAQLQTYLRIKVESLDITAGLTDKANVMEFPTLPPPSLLINNQLTQPLGVLSDFIRDPSQENARILFCAESAGRREVLLELLKNIDLSPTYYASWQTFLESDARLGITEGSLNDGLALTEQKIYLITESQLFGEQVRQQRRKRQVIDPNVIIRDLAELKPGSLVVHIDYGIGRYLGLQTIEHQGVVSEYLALAYAGEDKVYVPITSLNMISRYTGMDSDQVILNKLGTDKWAKAKKKVIAKIHDVAVELLEIYAKRQLQTRKNYPNPDASYYAFVSRFPFVETIDQTRAIEAICQDLQKNCLMDRLICGDVGFGKTEVAMRAAFLAVAAGYQVAILVPTTLLAEQHYHTFLDRFAETSINIDHLSRFRQAKAQEIIIDKLSQGKIDIIIGTHKLLQPGIQFKNLGLLIIDEEHRFGVRQKERFKALRANIDILSLTATPIPRTLNMSLAGMRDISIIATPPEKRLAIKTFVQERNFSVIRDAILREIMRGGQAFFLHNQVETIERIAEELRELIPQAKVIIAHGQMAERELERVMIEFYHHRYNVLVCTTIIETGIDIPTANTIIIDRADKFGLAQLHQLRGRVGRSQHQAYAYLMTPDKKVLSKDAEKRLAAIAALEDLGAGFTLATHDLEIRGSGELLGEEQSGHLQEIGFSLYMEWLEKTVEALKTGSSTENLFDALSEIEINLRISTIIPADYVPDMHLRLTLYKRIANATKQEALQELQIELIDRFGLLPPSVKALFQITQLKQLASSLGITKIDSNELGGFIDFKVEASINVERLIRLIEQYPQIYKLQGPQRLRFSQSFHTGEEKIAFMRKLLMELV